MIASLSLCCQACFNSASKKEAEVLSYVKTAIQDTSSRAYKLVNSYKCETLAPIAILGDTSVLNTLETFLLMDEFDNITGNRLKDDLPDFSGEIVFANIDECNSPYSTFINNNDIYSFRDLSTKLFVISLDTSYYMQNDLRQNFVRHMPKLLVLSSLYASAYAKDDIELLAKRCNNEIKIFDPISSIKTYLSVNSNNNLKTAIIADRHKAEIYNNILKDFSVSLIVSDSLDVQDLCDRLASDDYTMNYDNLIVDNSFQVQAIKTAILNKSEASNISKYINRHLNIVSVDRLLAEDVYMHMRKHNMFTHRVEYPMFEAYFTMPLFKQDSTINEVTDKSWVFTANIDMNTKTKANIASLVQKIKSSYVSR